MTPSKRRPRFRRVRSPAVRLTPDDLAIINAVGTHRFLRSTRIVELMSHRSQQKIIERLTRLYHAGILDRPRAQRHYVTGSTNDAFVYALGNEGAVVCAQHGYHYLPSVDWTDKNRDATAAYIDHALLLSDLMVAIEVSARAHRDIEFLDAETLRTGLHAKLRHAENPWRLAAPVTWHGKMSQVSIIPDAVFALRFKSTNRRAYFFVEADRAKMPVFRSDLSQSSFTRKLRVYLATHQLRQYRDDFGFSNFRVLTITKSVERLASMLAEVNSITAGRGSGLFLFTDYRSLLRDHDPLSITWRSTNGESTIAVSPHQWSSG